MIQNENKIYYTLRIAAAMCFIGHGAFGIIGKEIWCNYFAVFGIGRASAYHVMPFVGGMDILMGFSLLFYPTKLVFGWLVIWGCFTALLRPMSGEPFAEMIERAGNYGAPLALLLLCWKRPFFQHLFSIIGPPDEFEKKTLANVKLCLQCVVFLLLFGHGVLNIIEKKGIMQQYTALGFSNLAIVARFVGVFEITASLSILISPLRQVVVFLLVWKIATELFYPHWELFEWIERGGSYGALLALWFALPKSKTWIKRPHGPRLMEA